MRTTTTNATAGLRKPIDALNDQILAEACGRAAGGV